MTRRVLTETQAREWFDKFGPIEGQGFEEIFGSLDVPEKEDVYDCKVVHNIMFVKMRVRAYDVFGCTTQYVDLERYMILPQVSTL